MKKLLLLTTFSFLFILMVKAQKPEIIMSNKPGWHKIGETTVNFKTDKDALLVLGADKFKSILIKVTDAPIHLDDLEVYYESGNKQDVQIRSDFKKGGESHVIDLNGLGRNLKKVAFKYRTVPNWKGDKAHVELYGYK
jgi:hypothetical protein